MAFEGFMALDRGDESPIVSLSGVWVGHGECTSIRATNGALWGNGEISMDS